MTDPQYGADPNYQVGAPYPPAAPISPYPPQYPQQMQQYPQQPMVMGYQPAMMVTMAPTSGIATASMVLGIIGIVFGWFSFGIPSLLAIIFGHVGLSATKNNQRSGRGQAITGLVLGYITIIPMLYITFLIFGVIGAAATSTQF